MIVDVGPAPGQYHILPPTVVLCLRFPSRRFGCCAATSWADSGCFSCMYDVRAVRPAENGTCREHFLVVACAHVFLLVLLMGTVVAMARNSGALMVPG